MRPARLLLVALAAVPALLSWRATAQPAPSASPLATPASSSAVAGSASAADSAPAPAASASSSARQAPPTLAERLARTPLPDKPTPVPTYKEWPAEQSVTLGPSTSGCNAHLQREWLHLRCGFSVIDVSLLAGDSKDVFLNVVGEEFAREGDIVLALRRGRSQVIAVTTLEMGRYSSGLPSAAALVWVQWRDDESAPTVRVE